jgi:hypothetical protein
MIQPEHPPLISGTQFLAIVVMTIALFLVVDFGRRATTGYYVSQAEDRLEAEIEAETTRQAQLKARRDYVVSDEYVEKWAREQAHMVRPGDRPLVLLTPESPPIPLEVAARPASEEGSETTSSHVPNWYHWWRLFFDQDPKGFGAR